MPRGSGTPAGILRPERLYTSRAGSPPTVTTPFSTFWRDPGSAGKASMAVDWYPSITK
ncbi:MAG: hypothetical protein ACI35Q_00990 [Marinilabiliaceae bacterium]